MTTRMSIRRRIFAGVAGAMLGLAAWGTPAAFAGNAIDVSLNVPTSATVGRTVAATMTVKNMNFEAQTSESVTLNTITFVPSCGSIFSGGTCMAPFLDPSVLVPSTTTATGVAGSVCENNSFVLSRISEAEGTYSLTPRFTVTIPGPGTLPVSTSCVIALSLDVVRMPAIDANGADNGVVTDQLAFASGASPSGSSSDSGSDTTIVGKGAPDLASGVSPAAITTGQAVTDAATLTVGTHAAAPTGSVRFDAFAPGDPGCTGPPALTSTVAVAGTGASTVSGPLTPTSAGTWRVVATYPGDANYDAVATLCGDPAQTVTVSAVTGSSEALTTPGISTFASADVSLGGEVHDTATIVGRSSPAATGTVEFRLYGPGDATCATTPAFVSKVGVSAAGVATSASFAPDSPGTYRWRAFYSGDATNAPVSAACNAANESVRVAIGDGPQILAAAFDSPPVVGRSALLSIEAVNPQQPVSGVQVSFGEPRGLAGLSACRVAGLGHSVKPVTLKIPRVFTRAGAHTIAIDVLSGDCTGALRHVRKTIDVDVAASASTRSAPRGALAAGSIRARAAATAAGCKDRALAPTARNRPRIAAAVLCLVNVERAKRGRKLLLVSPRLRLAAAARSSDMVRRRYFEHEKVPGGPALAAGLRKRGFTGATYAENIGYASANTPQQQVQAWMDNPADRTNILHPRLRYAGVGVVTGIPVSPQRPGALYTMDFGATLR